VAVHASSRRRRRRRRHRVLGEQPGHWHCRGGSGPSLRTLLPSRPGSVTIHRRHRSRLGNRQARGHQPRW
jgi:hypothetical protein